jgi:hypothetical protein
MCDYISENQRKIEKFRTDSELALYPRNRLIKLNYPRRNFGYIENMLDMFKQGAFHLNHPEQRYLWVIREVSLQIRSSS